MGYNGFDHSCTTYNNLWKDGWLELPSQYGILYTVIMFAIGQVVFLIVQGRLLFKYGQTIGKRYLEIK